jgi:hypothetical protein
MIASLRLQRTLVCTEIHGSHTDPFPLAGWQHLSLAAVAPDPQIYLLCILLNRSFCDFHSVLNQRCTWLLALVSANPLLLAMYH